MTRTALTGPESPAPSPRVREVTLYRLTDVGANEKSMRAVFDEGATARRQLDTRTTSINGMPAVVLYGMRGGERPPDWQEDASRTTAVDLDLRATSPIAAVLVAVDDVVYAFSYGGGHHFIPRDLRDLESIGLAISPPMDVFDQLDEARSFRVRIGSVTCPVRTELREEGLVARLRQLHDRTLAQALKNGWIRLFEDANGRREIARHRNLCYRVSCESAPVV